MHLVLDPKQIGFFFRNGHLNLSSVFSSYDCAKFAADCNQLLTKRSSHSSQELSALQILFAGRDLWRDAPGLASFIRKGVFAQIASSIWWAEGGIRVLYDQLIPLIGVEFLLGASQEKFFNCVTTGTCNLAHVSAFSGVLGGLLMCVNVSKLDVGSGNIVTLPVVSGDILCVSEKCLFTYPEYTKEAVGLWYLVVFGRENSRYILNKHDPHVHRPKQMGYFLNDFLTSDRHPFIRLPFLF